MEMILEKIDTAKVSKLIFQQVDNVTCLECCKYYVAPETATCGHTLCQKCWKGKRSCPVCAVPIEKSGLKLNTTIQTLTGHVHALGETFEKLFKIKLNEIFFNTNEANEVENDPTKNVTNWLLDSQNQFSVPPTNSQQSSQQSQQFLHKTKIQIHSNTKKAINPAKVVLVPQPQDDWDKIELMPDKEDYTNNNENVVGPMDIEPFFFDEEYTTDNPRRSSRHKELKINDSNIKAHDSLLDNKFTSSSSNNESDKKKNKVKQNWNNVKKMRKEFSKLNKQNRNKLNVSIEMCKKSVINKLNLVSPVVSEQACYIIDDNTPNITKVIKETTTKCTPESKQITSAATGITNINHDIIINNKIPTNKSANLIVNNNKDFDSSKFNQIQITDDIINKEMLGDGNHGTLKNIECDSLPVNNSADDKQIELTKIPFFKKSALQTKYTKENNIETVNDVVNSNNLNMNTDDIEITIKVGNTLTNIYIKKKKNDVELQITTDREVQTNSDQQQPHPKDVYIQQAEINKENNINKINKTIMQNICKINECNDIKDMLNKTTSKEKNTNSAETVTGQFEITESEEKELSDVMKHIESESNNNIQPMNENYSPKDIRTTKHSQVNTTKVQIQERNLGEIPEDMEYLNDLDIFDSGSIKEPNVQSLKSTKNISSEILISTVKSNKNRMQQHPEKRDRETNDENEIPTNKKPKFIPRANSENIQRITNNEPMPKSKNKIIDQDSTPMNHDVIMSQVFSNIDADIENIENSSKVVKKKQNIKPFEINVDSITKKQLYSQNNSSKQNIQSNNDVLTLEVEQNTSNVKECTIQQKCSEIIFSLIDKDNGIHEAQKKTNQIPGPETQKGIENLLTPGMCRDLVTMHEEPIHNDDVEMAEQELGTPMSNDEDSDKSVVEETPQKNLSFSKLKHKNNMTLKRTSSGDKHLLQRLSDNKQRGAAEMQDKLPDSQNPKNAINLLESLATSKNVTVIEANRKETLETPLTINKFVGHIKHKSTPVARKSLNFANDDHDRTLYPTSSQVLTTTQEKEFMIKAFEKTPKSSESKSLNLRSKESRKFCIAGSCLTSTELMNVKLLCNKYQWTYVDKHTKDLTHLVVGVDEENKSQRSVKYMCALASGKWIISYTWVEKCLQTGEVIDEEPYEVLDSTGDPGPKRSRTAKHKLFRGITFYCMPPFSVLDVDTLKNMLEAAGGCVVNEARGVRVTDNKLALLLAEPEHTQEDRFIYLTMELSIVPVNYEWVLNCLGSYTLVSVHELLLCPASLLPASTARWPEELLSREDC